MAFGVLSSETMIWNYGHRTGYVVSVCVCVYACYKLLALNTWCCFIECLLCLLAAIYVLCNLCFRFLQHWNIQIGFLSSSFFRWATTIILSTIFVACGRVGYVCVAIIHRTLTWTTGSLLWAHCDWVDQQHTVCDMKQLWKHDAVKISMEYYECSVKLVYTLTLGNFSVTLTNITFSRWKWIS